MMKYDYLLYKSMEQANRTDIKNRFRLNPGTRLLLITAAVALGLALADAGMTEAIEIAKQLLKSTLNNS